MELKFREYLRSARSLDGNPETGVWNNLIRQRAEELPENLLFLSEELSNAGCILAGSILLKYLDEKESGPTGLAIQPWKTIDSVHKSRIKRNLLNSLGSSTLEVRETAARVISKIASIDLPRKEWTELVPSLRSNIKKTNASAFLKQASLVTLGCLYKETSGSCFTQDEVNAIRDAVIHGMNVSEKSSEIRLAAVEVLAHVLDSAQTKLDNMEGNNIMTVICEVAAEKEIKIREAAFKCLVSIASNYYYILEDSMITTLLNLTSNAIKGDANVVALEAVEFWISICSKELKIQDYKVHESDDFGVRHSQFIRRYLPTLVPMLLQRLLKVHIDHDQESEIGKLACNSRMCLGLVSRTVGSVVVPHVVNFLPSNIKKANWRFREVATYALGSILEGPGIEKLITLLKQGHDIAINDVKEEISIVTDTFWNLSPIFKLLNSPSSGFPVMIAAQLQEVLVNLLESIKDAPHVVETCGAICSLESRNVDPFLSSSFISHLASVIDQIHTSDRTISGNSTIRPSAYEILNEAVRSFRLPKTSHIHAKQSGELQRDESVAVTCSRKVMFKDCAHFAQLLNDLKSFLAQRPVEVLEPSAIADGNVSGTSLDVVMEQAPVFHTDANGGTEFVNEDTANSNEMHLKRFETEGRKEVHLQKEIDDMEENSNELPTDDMMSEDKEIANEAVSGTSLDAFTEKVIQGNDQLMREDCTNLQIERMNKGSNVLPADDTSSSNKTLVEVQEPGALGDESASGSIVDAFMEEDPPFQTDTNVGTEFIDESTTNSNEMNTKPSHELDDTEAEGESEVQQLNETARYQMPDQSSALNGTKETENPLDQFCYKNIPSFLLPLPIELQNDGKPTQSCILAGIILENALDYNKAENKCHLFQQWEDVDESDKCNLKNHLLKTLGSVDDNTSHAVSQLIVWIASVEVPQGKWTELFEFLLANIAQPYKPTSLKLATLETLRLLCNQIPDKDLTLHVDFILKTAVEGMNTCKHNPEVRYSATKILLHVLNLAHANLENEAVCKFIMEAICNAALEQQMENSELIESYLQTILDLTSDSIKRNKEAVALLALDFWCSVCDKEFERRNKPLERGDFKILRFRSIEKALLRLVPMLLETLCKQDEDQDQGKETRNLVVSSRDCLSHVCRTVSDSAIPLVVNFVDTNLTKAYWRSRQAALCAFGSILEGPSSEKLLRIVSARMQFLLDALKNENNGVKYSAASTLSRIFELLHAPTSGFSVITNFNLPRVLTELLDTSKNGVPRVAEKACEAMFYIAKGFKDAPSRTSLLTPYLKSICQSLFLTAGRTDGSEVKLRTSAYRTLNEIIKSSNLEESSQFIINLHYEVWNTLDHKLNHRRNMFSNDGENERCLCSLFAVTIQKLCGSREKKSVLLQNSGAIMNLLLNLFVSCGSNVREEVMLAISALIHVCGPKFGDYMERFFKYLAMGLQDLENYNLCANSVGVIRDICRESGSSISPYCDQIMGILLENLGHNELHFSVKIAIFYSFGDIARAIGKRFEKHINYVLPKMLRALRMSQMEDTSELMVGHVNQLRSSISEAYSRIRNICQSDQMLKYDRLFNQLSANFQQRNENENRISRSEKVKSSEPILTGEEAVAAVRKDVDKLLDQISELEAVVNNGTQVDKKKISYFTEMLMRQMLKLDAIEAEGTLKEERRKEVRRIQTQVEKMDDLKLKNSNILNKEATYTSPPVVTYKPDQANPGVSPSPSSNISQTVSSVRRIQTQVEKMDDLKLKNSNILNKEAPDTSPPVVTNKPDPANPGVSPSSSSDISQTVSSVHPSAPSSSYSYQPQPSAPPIPFDSSSTRMSAQPSTQSPAFDSTSAHSKHAGETK